MIVPRDRYGTRRGHGRDRYGDGAAVQTVNARELHGFLESRADFSTWIKQQIERARLAEGRDYLVHKIVERQNQGLTGQGRIDYHLTLEAAKHIGMMSGTDKGFEVRDYFIECERRAQHKDPASLTRAEILRWMATTLLAR